MISTLVLIYFDSPRLGHTIKTNPVKFQAVDPEISSNLFFSEKGLGIVSPTNFAYVFFREKYFPCYFIS